jgi:hypothetical protein
MDSELPHLAYTPTVSTDATQGPDHADITRRISPSHVRTMFGHPPASHYIATW